MKGLKILILGVNNIGVSISILLNRLGYSYFVSSLETMKLHLFKEGLIPISNKDFFTLIILTYFRIMCK